jgi:hypothetical protein
MESNELRIGNYVKDPYNKEIKLVSVEKDASMLRPIPLTEEWLLKFGFENWGTDEYGYMNYVLHNVIDGTSNFVIGLSDDDPIPMIDNDLCCWSEFKYVHTLQNLYFALTGEDLNAETH